MLLLRAAEAKTLPGVDPTEAQVKVVSEAEAYLARVRKRLTRRGGASRSRLRSGTGPRLMRSWRRRGSGRSRKPASRPSRSPSLRGCGDARRRPRPPSERTRPYSSRYRTPARAGRPRSPSSRSGSASFGEPWSSWRSTVGARPSSSTCSPVTLAAPAPGGWRRAWSSASGARRPLRSRPRTERIPAARIRPGP